MPSRNRLIEEILHSQHAIRNLIKTIILHARQHTGITHSQWFVLRAIKHAQKMSIKDIAAALEVSSSAATQLVDGLVEGGYVVRKENPADRRAVQLRLSAKGAKQDLAVNHKRISEMAVLFDSLTDRELAEYSRLNKKIMNSLSHKES